MTAKTALLQMTDRFRAQIEFLKRLHQLILTRRDWIESDPELKALLEEMGR